MIGNSTLQITVLFNHPKTHISFLSTVQYEMITLREREMYVSFGCPMLFDCISEFGNWDQAPSYMHHSFKLSHVVSTLSFITIIQIVHLKCSEEIATYVKKIEIDWLSRSSWT